VVEQHDRARVGRDAVPVEDPVEGVVLAVAEAADGDRGARILGAALGQRDPPGGEEVADPVVARLAVDVVVVVADGASLGRCSARKPLNRSDQAAMCTTAVGVITPSRSKSTAAYRLQSTESMAVSVWGWRVEV
jgi:hypothetical protein